MTARPDPDPDLLATAEAPAGRPLAGLRVAEWSRSIAGGYAGRTLHDAGAHVTRLGDPGASSLRPALSGYLHLGKVDQPGTLADVAALAADIVILELPDAPDEEFLAGFGDAAVVVITPWGLRGPWAGTGRPWSELTIQAESGSLSMRGLPGRPPLMTGSSEGLWVTGTMAAAAAVAAVQGGRAHRLVDAPLLEVTAYATNLFQDVGAAITGASPAAPPYRNRLNPSVEPASDGWVGFNLASAQNHEDFVVLIERADWLGDPQMTTHFGRYERYEEFTAAVRAWTTRHTVAEVVEQASAFRIPCAPVHNGRTILADPHVIDRGFYQPNAHDPGFLEPAPPFLFDGVRPRRDKESPPEARVATKTGAGAGVPDDALPFAGLRVLDLGTWWVGGFVGTALGALGADVLKVESTRRVDGARLVGPAPATQDHWWEQGAFYLGGNSDKRGITVDFSVPAGRELLARLIAGADVLIENYSPRVLESAGLGWDAVHELNPRLVMLRMPAFGLTGPRRSMIGYAQTVEQFSGLCWRTGYPDAAPHNPSGPADPMAAANSLLALSSALFTARRTGRGTLVESPLAEAALVMASEQVLAWTSEGVLLERLGNRDAVAAPQGVFPTAEPDRWVALTVADDEQWQALAGLMDPGRRATGDPELATADGRRARADELEKRIAAWTAGQERGALVERLLAAGIPAGEVRDGRFVHDHPHLAARGFYRLVELPWAGSIPLPLLPVRAVSGGWAHRRRPPTLGEHNAEVLGTELGLDEARLAELAADGIIGTVPLGV
ncbi:CoA transferase [Pseudofrankia sp. BMG5.37]|uniref:CoA transferase n=1 Tax=Pseudofrankia sp. BMG5.37 TaxID=3050035 RepID=UPI0028944861|nr:CoA transferase [Pseudofrankia sp. BMG5.37]MDT3440769.1 CoA transferase [Pseudofrankia sp. BMG5.37]